VSNEQNAPWLFPGWRAGTPLTSRHLASRLRRIGLPSGAGRKAALLDLAAQLPRSSCTSSWRSASRAPSSGQEVPTGTPTQPR
jgi:hypothetical protein